MKKLFDFKSQFMNSYENAFRLWIVLYNKLIDRRNIKAGNLSNDELDIYAMSQDRSDINDHLMLIFTESIQVRPKLIVELGVRGGASTRVFEKVAQHSNAHIISVDINDCSQISPLQEWHFVKSNDLNFADDFVEYCRLIEIKPEIDVLFIDTSHLYEQTAQEIKKWFPYLAKKCVVYFHDTNLKAIFKRKDGSIGLGWNNKRGVIRAIEEYLETNYNEKKAFVDKRKNWEISHRPWCSGLTILKRDVKPSL